MSSEIIKLETLKILSNEPHHRIDKHITIAKKTSPQKISLQLKSSILLLGLCLKYPLLLAKVIHILSEDSLHPTLIPLYKELKIILF